MLDDIHEVPELMLIAGSAHRKISQRRKLRGSGNSPAERNHRVVQVVLTVGDEAGGRIELVGRRGEHSAADVALVFELCDQGCGLGLRSDNMVVRHHQAGRDQKACSERSAVLRDDTRDCPRGAAAALKEGDVDEIDCLSPDALSSLVGSRDDAGRLVQSYAGSGLQHLHLS
ncbi:hypothetical protein J4G48_0006415 [Bradyrhizobium barranii subsp. apii]|nr:hypothetical protein [Bradyrhizobium barranii]UPT97729.1 hypothetical protein J4G48_0006415 [Bradyrhizobium barranii subsp. apii]